jgi:hypothetical protein
MTTASGLPRIPTGEPRLTFCPDEAAAASDIRRLPVNDLVRTGLAGSARADHYGPISRTDLHAFGGGDGT